jgi:hypothetical protein
VVDTVDEKPTTPGDWFQWDEPDGEWVNYMAMLEEGSNCVPSIDPPFSNEGEMIGAHIHHYMACRLFGKDNSLTSMDDLVSASFYVDNLMEKFVDKYVDEVLGVEAIIKDPDDDEKKIRCDLIAYCKDHDGECTIIDWKYVGKKFYYENYWDQMDRYKRAYNDAQVGSFGPLLSRVLVVAIFPSGRIRTHAYYGGDIN